MAFLMKPSSRYSSYDTRSSTSSHLSDPSSSVELKPKTTSSSRALVKSKPSDLSKPKSKPSDPNFTAMVRKFMEKRSGSARAAVTNPESRKGLVIPSDVIAEDLKKTVARKGSNFSALHKKLFGSGTPSSSSSSSSSGKKKEVKALTEVKGNTRTLAMVLRSERELLSLTKDQEIQISELKSMLEDKNTEVEKLKDLCLKQREEIKALKNAILFPESDSDKQRSELKHAKQLIPKLQRQVTSLTGQLQCLAEDLAEVKADKYSARKGFQQQVSSPKTPRYGGDDASNSSDFSLDDPASPGSPDDMLLKDLNPCLTPYYAKSRSKEFEEMGYGTPRNESLSNEKSDCGFATFGRKVSKSSDCCQSSRSGSIVSRVTRRSDETKCANGKQHHKPF